MKELIIKSWEASRLNFITDRILHGDRDCDITDISIHGEDIFLLVDNVFYSISKQSLSDIQNIGLEEMEEIIEILDQEELREMIEKAWIKDQSSQLFLHDLKEIVNQSTSIKLIPNKSPQWFSEYESSFKNTFIKTELDVIDYIPLNIQEDDNAWIIENEKRSHDIASVLRLAV